MPSDARFDDEACSLVLDYWRSKCVGGDIPARTSIDPYEVPSFLPDLYLMNVREDGQDFQYRLVGTRIEESLGLHFTGLWLAEVQPASILDWLLPLYRKAVADRCPVFSTGKFHAAGEVRLNARRLFAPLTTDGDRVGQLLCVQRLDYPMPRDAGQYGAMLSGVHDGLLNYDQSQYVLQEQI